MTTKTSGPDETVEEPTPFRIVVKEQKKDWGIGVFFDTLFFLMSMYCVVFVISCAWHDGAR